MNFAKFAVTRPVAVTMRIAALVLMGAVSFTRLPVDLLPEITIPTVAVNVSWPNVAPEEIETQITRPLERAVSSVPGLYEVSSSSQEGSASVRVQFQYGTDMAEAAADVLQQVQRARREFPSDPTLESPLVFKFDPSQLPIMIYGVSGEKDPIKLRTMLDNQIAPLLESANGVSGVAVSGGAEKAIMVEVNPERLRAHNLSLQDVSDRIVEENLNVPAGIAQQSETEYTIRSFGLFRSVEEISQIPIGVYNGQSVSLGQVAKVRNASEERRLYTRLNNEPSAGLIVSKQNGANTVSTSEAVMEKIHQAEKLYPDLTFRLAYDQSQFIESAVHNVQHHAIIGGILAVLILLFFLRNIRSTLVVALSIPISVVSTFALLYVGGFSINTMSLGGLALAVGLIVDDAVVVLENIFRHMERDGKSAPEAAIEGTNEIMSAVVASTFTVIVVFLPLLLIKGQTGQMFAQFALVVIFSIAVSLLDATSVVPMLASRLLKDEAHHENKAPKNFLEKQFALWGKWLDALDNSYRNGLEWALKRRWQVIGGALAVSAASFLLVPYIGSELMPETDSGDFRVQVKMPIGTSLDKTNQVMQQIERTLTDNPNVQTAFAAAGSNLSIRGTTTSLTANEGSVTVKLKEERKKSTQEVIGNLRKKFGQIPGARVQVTQFDLVSQTMSGGNQNLQVNIFGEDLKTLAALGKDLSAKMRDVTGLENVDVNWQEAKPELQWKVDRQKALQLGVTFEDIADTINTATRGTISSYYQEQGFQYPIIVQLPEERRKTVPELLNLKIKPSLSGPVGTTRPDVMLSQVAEPIFGVGPSEISRLNRLRYIAVSGKPEGRSSSEIQAEVAKIMQGVQLPTGYSWDWGSTQRRRAEEFAGLNLAVVLAIVLIYMLLASQFESFIHPLTVLTSVPLCAIGVILALFLTGRAFGLTAFIGVLMLVGIVVKNGILLVDYTNQLRERGMERDEAVLTAGPTRLRPILMTSATAIGGLFLIACGVGEGSETQAPMATTVIGGLLTSTILTLFIVPTVYTLFDDMGQWLQRRKVAASEPQIVVPTGKIAGALNAFEEQSSNEAPEQRGLSQTKTSPERAA
jgi:HAE1 family hydrophobic/amphiphilic exporter-1